MKDFSELETALKNKRIALVGNSNKVIGKQYQVDQHDVVIRMNRAWAMPEEMKVDVGKRIDILSVSIEQENIDFLVGEYETVLWMTPKHRDEFKLETAEKLYFYPLEWWQELYDRFGSNPSTGCMTFDVIRRFIGEGHVTLYGFDFFKSDNWYQKKRLGHRLMDFLGIPRKRNPHSGNQEEAFICGALPERQFKIEEL
ncbi:MAG: glycosyltransferase family 29 protein [Thiomicrorhabdus chilensis]|uniref:glycosyltransferase family 29 protein n=1 Tax=Thiomicrorhabdus chilensis TaxID=63656 RepID=UPI00299E8BA5|nr:glycosyltransferase family 29 protein [Thiomicrorhabdus chilensis]MDX1347268.1 glycosyltransferase family 29 protein [Thiomicrorhabdus chilensis]